MNAFNSQRFSLRPALGHLFLVLLLVAMTGAGGVSTAWAQANYVPADTATIRLASDGTHAGAGTETYLRSEYGYQPADDTAYDGVVSSGDVVAYRVSINLVAGPARTLTLKFSQDSANGALHIADFSRLTLGSGVISGIWNPENNTWSYTVPRGATGKAEGIALLRANDTHGMAVANNRVRLELVETAFTSVADPVTVISAPMADLTIEAGTRVGYFGPGSTNTSGSFTLVPRAISPAGFSSHGATAATEWITDVDVSAFPIGTNWSLGATALTVDGGWLRDLHGTGNARLSYTLPADTMPTLEEPARIYEIALHVHPEAFAAGELRNVPDPGNDQPANYRTSTYNQTSSVTGEEVAFNVLDGKDASNNNYSSISWYYRQPNPPGPKPLWQYLIDHPSDSTQTQFEPGNLYWHEDSPWYTQGRYIDRFSPKRAVTWDNDLSHRLTLLAGNLSCEDATGNDCVNNAVEVIVGDALTPFENNEGDYRPHYYDTTRNAVVVVDGALIDGSKYTIEWLVGDQWVIADRAPEGATASKVSFSEDAFDIGSGAPDVEVVWPAKAYDLASDKYVAPADNGHPVSGTGQLTLTDHQPKTKRDYVPLVFPERPAAAARITVDEPSVDMRNADGSLTTTWHVNNHIIAPVLTTGNTARAVLRLDAAFAPATFELIDASGWRVESIAGQEVTLFTDAPTLKDEGVAGWSLGEFSFQVNTVTNLYDPSLIVAAVATEDLTVFYPPVGDLPEGEATADSSATVAIAVSAQASSRIQTMVPKAEVNDEVAWDAYITAGSIGDDQQWSQEIRLPRMGDIDYMAEVSASNEGEAEISIDPDTGLDTNGIYDGVGRSWFTGSYELSSVVVEGANDTTTVTFYNKDADGNRTDSVQRTVGPGGVVDLSGVGDRTFFEVASTGNISANQEAGAVVHFAIKPEGNTAGDDYVAWLSPLQTPGVEPPMPWPDSAKVVSSVIAGTVWQDQNDDTRLGEDEPRHEGVTVALERQVDGAWSEITRTTTSEDGTYRFEGLHSGTYRVVLPNVTRGEGRLVTGVNGQLAGTDGETLSGGKENRFGVFTATEQTRSYLLTNAGSSSTAQVNLGVDTAVTEVDFGYLVPSIDAALDKSPARLSSNSADEGFVGVSWDVTVENTGNRPIEGLRLSDRTSGEVRGLTASVGYVEEWDEIIGTPVAVTGGSTADGFGVLTEEGYWLVNGDGTVVNVAGITGAPIGVTGNNPLDPVSSSGSGVLTTDGYWIVDASGSATAVDGITGTPIMVTGEGPGSTSGSGVLTSDGYWIVDPSGAVTKVEGISGAPIAAVAAAPFFEGSYVITDQGLWRVGTADQGFPAYTTATVTGTPIALVGEGSDSEGFGVATTTGYWIGSRSSRFIVRAVKGITGDFIAMSGDAPYSSSTTGSAVITSDGYWVIDRNGNAVKLAAITGTPVAVVGAAPNSSDGLAGVLTTDGYWLTRADHTAYHVPGITGQPIAASGSSPANLTSGSSVLTSDGYWIVRRDPDTADTTQFTATATKVADVTGEPVTITGGTPASAGSGFATSTGFWVVSPEGTAIKAGSHRDTIVGQSLAQSEAQLTESAFGRDWVRRVYELPTLLPGEKMVVTLSGSVAKDANPLVVGNQAWITSEQTPREGMETVDDESLRMTVTGAEMTPGVPDIPQLPSVEDAPPAGRRHRGHLDRFAESRRPGRRPSRRPRRPNPGAHPRTAGRGPERLGRRHCVV